MTKMTKTIAEQNVVHHPAFAEASHRAEQCFRFASEKSEAEGMAIVGESGTGKTSVLDALLRNHPRSRDENGWTIPILLVTVPSSPTVKSLATVILEALGVPDPDRGVENEKTRRIRKLFSECKVLVLLIDEFQHFFDRGSQKIMYRVADWLKILIDQTRTTLIVAGLPSCLTVIDQNEQLARRFASPARFSRFDWKDDSDRKNFLGVMRGFSSALKDRYDLPRMETDDMAFRFWIASGGLIAYVVKILVNAERNAMIEERRVITMEHLHRAHMEAVWATHRESDIPLPFVGTDVLSAHEDLYQRVAKIGVRKESAPQSRHRPARARHSETVSSILRTR